MSDAATPGVCRRLRAKGAPGLIYDDAVSWDAGYNSSVVYWCTATADRVGPDDSFVHAHACCAGRACYEPQIAETPTAEADT